MKICVPTMGSSGMDEAVCQHFGRAPTFTVVDLDTGKTQVLLNQSQHMGGSGLPIETIFAADIQVMIVGGLGPKAVSAFEEHCVEVFVGASGTVRDALYAWRNGQLMKASRDNACKDHKH
ncbi:MAG TPA: NifB/NifX family molybdenum-iron cluster-binding protein [Methanothrix sp.]|nr:NifB/NifX family molybdenum-iron cluster-binding protein [Methanothrix sp.]